MGRTGILYFHGREIWFPWNTRGRSLRVSIMQEKTTISCDMVIREVVEPRGVELALRRF